MEDSDCGDGFVCEARACLTRCDEKTDCPADAPVCDNGICRKVVVEACDGATADTERTRTRFASASVAFGEACQSETQTQTCESGYWTAWSGTFVFDACIVRPRADCGVVVDGTSETRRCYEAAAVPADGTCTFTEQSRTCKSGVFDPDFPACDYTSCEVAGHPSCGATPHGNAESRQCYTSVTVPYGSTCSSTTQTRTCRDGSWSPDYPACAYLSCTVNAQGCTTAHNTNVNASLSPQSGEFEIQWDVRPEAVGIDAAVGLTKGSVASALAFAASVRFNDAGMIDCRNGGSYGSLVAMPYAAGTTYRVRETVNVPGRTYSVYIREGSGSETALARDYAFRSDYPAVDDLDNWVVGANVGDLTACFVSVASTGVSVLVSPASATVVVNGTQQFSATVVGTANQGVTWEVVGTGCGSVTSEGLYTAPGAVPAGGCSVKATSVADRSKSASASLTVRGGGVEVGPLAAFPGCEGMGCGATGGRGGAVYTVNTLEDTTNAGCVAQNGPTGATCSLRDVMEKSGVRMMVFSVSGTIAVHSTIYSVQRGLTIAGQTAPGGGIQIKGDGTFGNGGSMLWLEGNSVVRYLRIRPGNAPLNTSLQGLTGLGVSRVHTDDVVIDHNSFQWDSNKPVSWWSDNGLRRNTLSWNLIAESLDPHSTGPLVGGQNMGQANMDESSWDGHHNLLATFDHRVPQTWVKYGRWVNNLAVGYRYAMLIRGGTQFDIIGNVWEGMSYGIKAYSSRHEVRWARSYLNNANQIVPGGTAQIYMSNNFGPNNQLGTSDNFNTMLRISFGENGECTAPGTYCTADDVGPVDTQYKATAPTIPASLNGWPITITTLSTIDDLKDLLTPAVGAYRRLACDGSWVANRDSADAHIISYVSNPATSPTSLVSTAGPYPDLSGGTACTDTDGDGMPDVWENAHGLDSNDAADRNTARANANGYTNLDLYLSGLFPNGVALP